MKWFGNTFRNIKSFFLYTCVFMDFHTHLKCYISQQCSKIFTNTFYIMHSFLRDEDCSREPLQCGSKK